MMGTLKFIGLIVAIFLFALLVDQITPLKQFDAYLREHSQPWVGLTLGAVVVGLGLLVFVWISWLKRSHRPMSEEEAQEFMRTSASQLNLNRVVLGRAFGITAPEGVATFRQVKDAFRSGAWLRDPYLRVFCVGVIGLLLLVLGGFGYFAIIGPPTVKVICVGVLLYVFGRTAWGFWQA